MPKPVGSEKTETVSTAADVDITETNEGGVEVSVDNENPDDQSISNEVVKEDGRKPVTQRQDPLTNKVYAHDRILSNVQKSIEELKSIMLNNTSASTITTEQVDKLDEIDKLAQSDWKAAVAKIAETRTREILSAENKKIEQAKENETSAQIIEKNAQLVISRHTELEDPASEKSTIFQNILTDNPRWRVSPDGPLLVMYEMERELRKRGYAVGDYADSGVRQNVAESARISRVAATNLPASRIISATGNKIVLTREQREFCDQNGVKYEDYARTLSKTGGKEGITI